MSESCPVFAARAIRSGFLSARTLVPSPFIGLLPHHLFSPLPGYQGPESHVLSVLFLPLSLSCESSPCRGSETCGLGCGLGCSLDIRLLHSSPGDSDVQGVLRSSFGGVSIMRSHRGVRDIRLCAVQRKTDTKAGTVGKELLASSDCGEV